MWGEPVTHSPGLGTVHGGRTSIGTHASRDLTSGGSALGTFLLRIRGKLLKIGEVRITFSDILKPPIAVLGGQAWWHRGVVEPGRDAASPGTWTRAGFPSVPPACVFGVLATVILCAWEAADGSKRVGEGQRDGVASLKVKGGLYPRVGALPCGISNEIHCGDKHWHRRERLCAPTLPETSGLEHCFPRINGYLISYGRHSGSSQGGGGTALPRCARADEMHRTVLT